MKSRDVLACSKTDTMPRYLDLKTRAAEEAVLPRIVLLFNKFLICLKKLTIESHLTKKNNISHPRTLNVELVPPNQNSSYVIFVLF